MTNINILKLISNSNGWIGFDEFMFSALYDEKNGYYTKSITKKNFGPFGKHGDFITAPMLGPWIGMALAKNFMKLRSNAPLDLKSKLSIREIGGGSGHLAAEILVMLKKNNFLPNNYEIIEINKSMQDIQKEVIEKKLKENFGKEASLILEKVKWKTKILNKNNFADFENQKPVTGMIIANELIDAFPVKIFRFVPSKKNKSNSFYECGVSIDKHKNFFWVDKEAKGDLLNQIKKRYEQSKNNGFPWYKEKLGEWSPYVPEWCCKIVKKIDWGEIVILDYGKERFELDHPMMVQSTLCGFSKHKQINSLKECIKNPGLQDLTSHVDFSSLVEEFSSHKPLELEIKTQGAWLLDSGILDEAEKIIFDEKKSNFNLKKYNQLSSLQNILSDSTMSESFLVLKVKKI
ncbi:MAG: hypothetical protein CBD16_08615 [Betaproteobacteria bacterium TMED156]|nr:MAG: hypothetical protein CBD16_08615 [Betaproteobacteria bacterium TMED156]